MNRVISFLLSTIDILLNFENKNETNFELQCYYYYFIINFLKKYFNFILTSFSSKNPKIMVSPPLKISFFKR